MRPLVFALLLLPLPALAQAQGLFGEDGEPLPWPEPRRYAAPARLLTDTLRASGDVPRFVVYAQGANGQRETVIPPTERPPVRVVYNNGWVGLSQGCGQDCTLTSFVDRQRGRVAGPIANVLDVDVVHDRVVAAGAEGLVVLDPFDPGSARAVALPLDLAQYPSPMLVLQRVAFVLNEGTLAVTVRGDNGEEASFEVPLDGADSPPLPAP